MPGQGAEHNAGRKAAFHRQDHQPLRTNDRRSRLQQVTTEDIATTEQIVSAGKLLDVELVDHIIIGSNNRFVSLKERIPW